MWKMFLAECFFSWFTRTKYLLQYTKPSNCSGLVFIRLKWWRLPYTFYIQQLWYLPFCSSGWIGKHGPLSIFIGGHQSTTATGVGLIIIDNFSSHSSTSIFSSLFLYFVSWIQVSFSTSIDVRTVSCESHIMSACPQMTISGSMFLNWFF